jgi:hypothetical protein
MICSITTIIALRRTSVATVDTGAMTMTTTYGYEMFAERERDALECSLAEQK